MIDSKYMVLRIIEEAQLGIIPKNAHSNIDSFLLPWFAEKDTADAIKDMLLSEKKKRENHGGRLSDSQTYWLNIIENNTWNNELVAANIETFKLPKKLIR